MHRRIVAAALRVQRSATLDALQVSGWGSGEPGAESTTDHVARLIAVDHGLVTGRLLLMVRASPTRGVFDASLAAAAESWRRRPPRELLDALARMGDRTVRVARRLPPPVAGVRLRGWFGRQPVSYLFVRRVLEEWARVPAASGTGTAPPPEVGHCLGLGVLAALPAAALPRVDVASGVVRLVVDVAGGEHLAVGPRRRRGRPAREVRRPPARVTWSFDFARRHYGPRVTGPPDAVVRLSAHELALLAEAGRQWRGNPEIALEGDERLAAALLDRIGPAERSAGTVPLGRESRS